MPGNYQTQGCSYCMWTQLSQKLIRAGCGGIMGKNPAQGDCIPLWLQWDVSELVVLTPTGSEGWGSAGFSLISDVILWDKGFLKNLVVYWKASLIFHFRSKDCLTGNWSPEVMLLWEAVTNTNTAVMYVFFGSSLSAIKVILSNCRYWMWPKEEWYSRGAICTSFNPEPEINRKQFCCAS